MNKVQHYEIPTDDPARSQKFYNEVFGWEVNKMPDMDYWEVKSSTTGENGRGNEVNAISGGMQKRNDETGPTLVVSVDDIDETLKKVTAQGGSIVLDKQAMGEDGAIGFYARFKDSEGNVLGLWAPKKE